MILVPSHISNPPFPHLISLKRQHSRVSTHVYNSDAPLSLRKLEAYSILQTRGRVSSKSPLSLTLDLEGSRIF